MYTSISILYYEKGCCNFSLIFVLNSCFENAFECTDVESVHLGCSLFLSHAMFEGSMQWYTDCGSEFSYYAQLILFVNEGESFNV